MSSGSTPSHSPGRYSPVRLRADGFLIRTRILNATVAGSVSGAPRRERRRDKFKRTFNKFLNRPASPVVGGTIQATSVAMIAPQHLLLQPASASNPAIVLATAPATVTTAPAISHPTHPTGASPNPPTYGLHSSGVCGTFLTTAIIGTRGIQPSHN